jgi:hypothetical protein
MYLVVDAVYFDVRWNAKFSNFNTFKVIANLIPLWAWPLFRRYPYVAETLIYWLGFQWVRLRVEGGKGGLIHNFVLNHIYFRNLAHQQKDARGGGDGTLWPTNINQNCSTYCFKLIRCLDSLFAILCSKEHRAETQPTPQSDWLWAGIIFLVGVSLGPHLWSSGLQIKRSRVRFPTLPGFLRNSGSWTVSNQPREYNRGDNWREL